MAMVMQPHTIKAAQTRWRAFFLGNQTSEDIQIDRKEKEKEKEKEKALKENERCNLVREYCLVVIISFIIIVLLFLVEVFSFLNQGERRYVLSGGRPGPLTAVGVGEVVILLHVEWIRSAIAVLIRQRAVGTETGVVVGIERVRWDGVSHSVHPCGERAKPGPRNDRGRVHRDPLTVDHHLHFAAGAAAAAATIRTGARELGGFSFGGRAGGCARCRLFLRYAVLSRVNLDQRGRCCSR